MKCERCGKETEGYELFDYCEYCSRNLCDECMAVGTCPDTLSHKHAPHRDDDGRGFEPGDE